MPGMTASAIIYVEEKTNTLLLSGKAMRFTPDQAYMKKMFEKMQASGAMPKMPAGAPTGTGATPQNMPVGQTMQGMPVTGMVPGAANADPKTKTVWVKDDKMGLRPNMVKIGIDNGTNVEIVSGLKEGDEVIISIGDKEIKTTTKKTQNGPPGFPF
jgi:HlyD family secretion protein